MDDRERQLESEGAERARVAYLAIFAGVAYVLGELFNGVLITAKLPTVGLLQGLGPALHGTAAARIDPRTIDERFLNTHAPEEVVIWLVIALAVIAMRWPLLYLRDAAVARGAQDSNVTRVLAAWAPLLLGVLVFVYSGISLPLGAHQYMSHAARTYAAITSATAGPVRVAIGLIAFLGTIGMAGAFILISQRAMRVGLLTRVLGYLGIVGGVLFIIPLVPVPLIQFLWLVGIAMTLLQRGGLVMPPAWAAGEAVPWVPMQRTDRSYTRGGSTGRRGRVAKPAPAPSVPAVQSPSASKKRKRRGR